MGEASLPAERVHAPVPELALWFTLLGGPVAWTAHLLASYPLVRVACRLGGPLLLNGITATTALLSTTACLMGLALLGRLRRGGRAHEAEGPGPHAALRRRVAGRARFMALSGAILGAFFTLVVLVEGLPPLTQDPCVRVP